MSSRTGQCAGGRRERSSAPCPATAEPRVAGMAFTLHTGHKPGGLRQRGDGDIDQFPLNLKAPKK